MVPLLASLTLGLAPFVPEPHIVEKIRRIASQPSGLSLTDWFDFVMHGWPWVWLIWRLLARLRPRR